MWVTQSDGVYATDERLAVHCVGCVVIQKFPLFTRKPDSDFCTAQIQLVEVYNEMVTLYQ